MPDDIMRFTLDDLILLKDAGVALDAADVREVYVRENVNRSLLPCEHCDTPRGGQHLPNCPRESVLALENWYEIVSKQGIDR